MDFVQTFLDLPPKFWTPKYNNFVITRFKYTISVEYVLDIPNTLEQYFSFTKNTF